MNRTDSGLLILASLPNNMKDNVTKWMLFQRVVCLQTMPSLQRRQSWPIFVGQADQDRHIFMNNQILLLIIFYVSPLAIIQFLYNIVMYLFLSPVWIHQSSWWCVAQQVWCKSCARIHFLAAAAAPFLGVVEVRQRAAMLQDVMTDQTRKPAPLTILHSVLDLEFIKLSKIRPLEGGLTVSGSGWCDRT